MRLFGIAVIHAMLRTIYLVRGVRTLAPTALIYVPLLDEGTEVWRPVGNLAALNVELWLVGIAGAVALLWHARK